MADLADAFIAMPGGFGTFEEFCEILTWTQLGIHRKPAGILNVDGFYDPLLDLFDQAVREGFLRQSQREMVIADPDPETLVDALGELRIPLIDKWIGNDGASLKDV